MKRLLPYFIICFAIIAFSKLMTVFNSNTGITNVNTIHAESNVIEKQKPQPIQRKIPVTDAKGNTLGEVYNLDTSQIQQIAACSKLYDLNFSTEEVQVLQTLRDRHDQLNILEEELKLKKDLLEAIQNEIIQKIDKLEKLRLEVNGDDGQLGGSSNYGKLVKIYEGMKAKEAAKIFDALQINVILGVAQQMKENKLAAIVAEMQPEKARDLTMALATKKDN